MRRNIVRDYKQHIIDTLNKRKDLSGRFNLDIRCPICKTQLQKGAFSVNEGGGLWSGRAYCCSCGWVGVYLYYKDSKGRIE